MAAFHSSVGSVTGVKDDETHGTDRASTIQQEG